MTRAPAVLSVAGVLLCCLLTWSLAGQSGPAATAIERLRSADNCVGTADEILADRLRTVRDLIGIVEAAKPDHDWLLWARRENQAIRILGEMREPEAVPVLIKWLEPPDTVYFVSGSAMGPAYYALIKIGKPAEPALIDVLKKDPSRPIWKFSLSVLDEIEGKKCLEVILGDALAKEKDHAAKANLQRALTEAKRPGVPGTSHLVEP